MAQGFVWNPSSVEILTEGGRDFPLLYVHAEDLRSYLTY